MTGANFTILQTRVNRRLIDLPTQVTAEVPTLINEAIKDLQRDHNFDVMQSEVSATTTVGTITLAALPSDWKEFRGQPYAITYAGRSIKLKTIAKISDMFPDIGLLGANTGSPQVILYDSVNFNLLPISDSNSDYSDGQYRIKIPYWKYFPDLSAGTDQNWFSLNADRFIIEWATAQGFGLDWDEEHMAVAMQKAEVERKKLILQDKRMRLSSVTELAIHKNVNDAFLRV